MNPMQFMGRNNPIMQILNILVRGMNPQALAQNIMQRNPDAQKLNRSLHQNCGNQNPRDFILEQCRNNGYRDDEILQIAQHMGLR